MLGNLTTDKEETSGSRNVVLQKIPWTETRKLYKKWHISNDKQEKTTTIPWTQNEPEIVKG